MLVDSGMPVDRAAFEERLWSLVDPGDLRWVVVTHDDRDHTGSLAAVLARAPGAKLITNAISLTRLSEEFDIPAERVITVNPGSRMAIGDRRFTFFRPPTFDSPGTPAMFDHRDGTLFSTDSFGNVVPERARHMGDVRVEEFLAGFEVLNRAIAPWTAMADAEKFGRSTPSWKPCPASRVCRSGCPALTWIWRPHSTRTASDVTEDIAVRRIAAPPETVPRRGPVTVSRRLRGPGEDWRRPQG
ncbi:MBL fold metallo-hydrolase [Streptomyces glaucescens]|uniref:MBL fold metallo-hydrolase n=1 Tax=Streptomyces glaucescens TaxID=1907 RepID=UPI00344FC53E